MPTTTISPHPTVAETLTRCRDHTHDGELAPGLLEVLHTVPDPRDPRGIRYPLAPLLGAATLATAAGMRGATAFATWSRTASQGVFNELGIRFRRPSEKTFRSLLARLDPADLDRRIGAWFATIATAGTEPNHPLVVAADGKTLRSALRRGATDTHLVSVFTHDTELVIGQLAVTEKTNEIPIVRKLFKQMPRRRMLITLDAMHTQTATAKLIRAQLKSDYLLVVKANQPGLLTRITNQPWDQVPIAATDDSRGHGRVEHRDLQILSAPRGIGFPYARQLIRITRDRLVTKTGKRSVEVVYAVCSLPFDEARPTQIATWLLGHWGIENSVHWCRDVTYDEDRNNTHTGASHHVLATLRNTAMNLHRLDGATNIAEACREAAFVPNRRIDLLKPQKLRSRAR